MGDRSQRFQINEWFLENDFHLRRAEEQCKLGERVLAESERIREIVGEIVEVNKNETNERLRERIDEEEYLKNEIERIRTEIYLELEPLEAVGNRITAAIKSVESCGLNITKRCLLMREGRIGIDLVNDDVEKALQQELKTIEGGLAVFRRCLEQVSETKRQLKVSLYQLNKDLQNKLIGMNIDKEASLLRETNVGLSIYQGTDSLDPATISPKEWGDFTETSITSALKRVNTSRPLRCYFDTILKQVEKDLLYADQTVNEAFRIRIEQVQQAKNKLELRHSEVVRQANDQARVMDELEKAIADKDGYLGLAHTRLGKRAQRPGAELVRDAVNGCLNNEVLEIREVVAQLRQKHVQAQAVQRQLLKTQVQLEEDINIKINSLKIDEVDCMTLRQSIQHPVF